ncbi:hypothetical protein KI387_030721, partial [Taxus chinensis]
MDSKARKLYTSRDVEFFENKEFDAPSTELPDIDSKPIVKIKVDVPTNDDIDDWDD